jgi:hypothetical protein
MQTSRWEAVAIYFLKGVCHCEPAEGGRGISFLRKNYKNRDCEPDRFRGQARNKKYPVSKASLISKKEELKIRRPICYRRKILTRF